jgi:NADH-quinone oxidoreductase subunit N
MSSVPMPSVNLGLIAPEIIIVLAACAMILLEVSPLRRMESALAGMSLLGIVLAGIFSFSLRDLSQFGFNSMVVCDGFSSGFNLVLLAAAGLATLIGAVHCRRENLSLGDFLSLMLLATAGMMFMGKSADLVMVFLSLETFSIALYVLSGFARPRLRSEEAALKYFLLGAFASGFLLFGIALLYGATGTTNLYQLASSGALQAMNPDPLAIVGMVLLIIGFAFKVSFVPFHMWTPDVYEGAPTPVTAFMSLGAKAAGFAALFRILYVGMPDMAALWTGLISGLSILTMIYGNGIAVAQYNIKRMLAYSSIAHAGYLGIAVVVGTPEAIAAVLFYLLSYCAMNMGAFAIVVALERRGETNLDIRDYAGMSERHPGLSALMALFMLSLAGIPPTAGFFAKLFLFAPAVEARAYTLAIVAVVSSVLGAYYYLRVIWFMYFEKPLDESPEVTQGRPLSVAAILAAVGVLGLGFFNAFFLGFAEKAQLLAPAVSQALLGR